MLGSLSADAHPDEGAIGRCHFEWTPVDFAGLGMRDDAADWHKEPVPLRHLLEQGAVDESACRGLTVLLDELDRAVADYLECRLLDPSRLAVLRKCS